MGALTMFEYPLGATPLDPDCHSSLSPLCS